VKTISIKELHAATGRWVRAARKQTIIVTDRGEKIAALKPHTEAEIPRPVFTLKGRDPRPKIDFDSTIVISEDRDRW
jgi:antitoxin (DNA-binding transcriptional repressor) of toxin-antitoxin stability system